MQTQIFSSNIHKNSKEYNVPHYLRDHIEQMLHYVAENHFLNQEASAMALNHHYVQYQPGCACPKLEKYI